MLNVDSADTPTDESAALDKRTGEDVVTSSDGEGLSRTVVRSFGSVCEVIVWLVGVAITLSSAASNQSSGHIYTIVTAARYEVGLGFCDCQSWTACVQCHAAWHRSGR
jgi:hypothetical protein